MTAEIYILLVAAASGWRGRGAGVVAVVVVVIVMMPVVAAVVILVMAVSFVSAFLHHTAVFVLIVSAAHLFRSSTDDRSPRLHIDMN